MDKPSPAAAIARSSIASALRWRKQANHLRRHAALPHLTPHQRKTLLHEAEAADRQAQW